jgi:hypothetical protein
MLHWLYTYVASVCFKCFSCFKRVLQVFYLDVAYVVMAIHICCKRMFVNISFVSDYVAPNALCCKCCMTRRVKWAQTAWSLGHARSEEGATAPTCMRRRMRTAAVGGDGPAGAAAAVPSTTATAARGQVRQQRASRWARAACMRCGAYLSKVGGLRHGACVRRMHLGKCVACAISCYMQRECVRGVGGQ